MRPAEYLAHYSKLFSTVEIDATFYRLPTAHAVWTWRRDTPRGFVFSCKASRFITHMKKLKDPDKSTPPFFSMLEGLGPKLGPILFQLPPRWHANLPRLRWFLDALPTSHTFVFEFRDPSWFRADILSALADKNAACCIYDLDGTVSPFEITSDVVYVRLHGPNGPYQGTYSKKAIEYWADRLVAWRDGGRDVYCYFDNDQSGYAVRDATTLTAALANL